jgi:fucose 4-O-acetylase-like acetyltransferase
MSGASTIRHIFGLKAAGTSDRYAWIDYAKGIAIILVAYRHVVYGLLNSGVEVSQPLADLNTMLYSFRMPLFFVLSGLFFNRSVQKRGGKAFMQNKAGTLLYPYLLWALIQITLQIVFSRFANAQRGADAYLDIFIQPRNLDQLWYLFALFNVSALYFFTSQVLRIGDRWQLLIGLVLLGIAPLVQPWSTLYDIALHYIFFSIGCNVAGHFFSGSFKQSWSQGKRLLLALPPFIAVQLYFLFHQDMNLYLYAVVALAGSAFILMLSFWLEKKDAWVFLRVVGNYSLYIYLLHVMVIAVLRTLILKSGIAIPVPVLLVFLIAAGIYGSIVSYRICILLKLDFLFRAPSLAGSNVQAARVTDKLKTHHE